MKVSCSRSELRDALRVVGGVVDPRNIKPILKDIHLRTTESAVELSATDLEVGIKYFVRDIKVEETGGIVIPADPLNGIVSESREERLSLLVEDSSLRVVGVGSRWKVMGVSEEEFPEIPDFPDERSIEVEGSVLCEMIAKTIFAVGVEKQRYALNGALLVVSKGSPRMEMVGSDGRRMAWIQRRANIPSPFDASSILPLKALQQVEKMIGREEIIRIILEERRILLKADKGVLVAQLLEGRFPPYKEVVPKDYDKRAEMPVDDFTNAVRQAAVLVPRESRAVALTFKQGKMVVESSSPESGDARVEMPVKYEGEAITIHFNPDYLLDGTKAMNNEVITLEMKDSSRAAVMRGGTDYLYLIMPISQD